MHRSPRFCFAAAWPFGLFKDATRGDRYARAAAYRHNRDMRIHLPGYLARWVLVSAATLAVASGFSALSAPRAGAMNVFAVLAAVTFRVSPLPAASACCS